MKPNSVRDMSKSVRDQLINLQYLKNTHSYFSSHKNPGVKKIVNKNKDNCLNIDNSLNSKQASDNDLFM